jgi:hypothetical protein
MPQQQALPTWLTLNSQNSASQSGQTDPITGFPYAGGGLNQGDYFDVTNDEAAQLSNPATGLLFQGRYRYVQVDSGATAANVKTGTVGFARSGSSVATAVTTAVGTGLTNGSYQVAATVGSGGGAGAILGINVAGGVIVGNPTVVAGGFGYVSPPAFSLTALGGSGASVVAQLAPVGMNIVTSADIALGTGTGITNAGIGPVHPVVFLNAVTPGNFGFVQELGTATVLANATAQTQSTFAIVQSTSPNGTMTTSSATPTPYVIGTVIDPLSATAPANTPFKILMNTPVVQD